MGTDQPTRALLHKVVTTAKGPSGTSYTVAYFEDPDGDKLLAFASSEHFGDLNLLPLMTVSRQVPCPLGVKQVGRWPALRHLPMAASSGVAGSVPGSPFRPPHG
jgi:hypothetical protein